jgi:hypothetical protein
MSVSLQLPILFDISAAGVVFGEDVSGVDIFDAHLKFTLDASEVGGPAAKIKEVFSDILYSDASENDVSGVLFYYNTLSASPDAGDIASVIQAAILNGKLKQAAGATYGTDNSQSAGTGTSNGTVNADSTYAGTDWTKRYQAPGIPLPMYSVTTASSIAGPSATPAQGYYIDALCDAGGTNFGRVLIRLMATSLMGHPFAQGFIKNESKIMEDISNCDISTQLGDNLFKGFYFGDDDEANYPKNRNIKGVTGAVLAAANTSDSNTTASKSDGIHNGILQQMYEQLLGSAPERFDISGSKSAFAASDASGNDADQSTVFPNRLPIKANDTISFYFRPRVQISMDTDASSGVSTVTVDDTTGTHDAGVENEGDVASSYAASNTNLSSIFFQPRHRWISHPSGTTIAADGQMDGTTAHTIHKHCDADGKLVMEGTNLITQNNNKLVFDGHVWRILCKIPAAA